MPASSLLPRDRHDFERLDALIAAGPNAAIPILPELLAWLQDINWPIAAPLAAFLVSVGEPLLPHIKTILSSNDDMWIYWVLQYVVEKLPPNVVRQLRRELATLIDAAENDLIAIRVGVAADLWDDKTLARILANKICAHETILAELKTIDSLRKTHER